jgi:hypothetical protein
VGRLVDEEDLSVSLTGGHGLCQGDVDAAIVLYFEVVIQSEDTQDSEQEQDQE